MSTVVRVETFIVTLPRETPYLGPLGQDESVNSRGYIVRTGNGTIYPTVDRSIVVRVTTEDGSAGWGETYGLCAPRATCEIINDLLAPVLIGREPDDVEAIWDTLYGLMRVRGCTVGFHGDAIAALDIALWDLRARAAVQPLSVLLGDTVRATVPSYLSGLPEATLSERVALALDWQRRGQDAFKFAAVVSHEGIVKEMSALRSALGDDVAIMVDLHWKFGADAALAIAAALLPLRPAFIEAPVKPEDIAGLARVAREATVPVAAGEEWYTEHDARARLAVAPLQFVQPEMGHTGVTQFMRIAAVAAEYGASLAPHATIGTGLFLSASLHASATLPHLWRHEWQHSVFGRSLELLDTDMAHGVDGYVPATGPGLGAVPGPAFWAHADAVT